MLPSLRSSNKNRLLNLVSKVNFLCQYLTTTDLKATVDLMFAAAQLVTDILMVSHRNKLTVASPPSMPPWKIRMQNTLASMRKDLSRLVAMQSNQLKNPGVIKSLYSRYLDRGMTVSMAIEILRQKVAAVSKKLRRYTARVESYHQNGLFLSDQRKFYKQLSSFDEPMSSGFPMIGDDIVKFWSTLWGDTTPHCAGASWITSVGSTLHNLCAQEKFVTARLVATAAKKLNNWKVTWPRLCS